MIDARKELPDWNDEPATVKLYQEVKQTVESGIQQAMADREVDPDRELPRRVFSQLSKVMPAFDLMKEVIE